MERGYMLFVQYKQQFEAAYCILAFRQILSNSYLCQVIQLSRIFRFLLELPL